MPTLHAFICCGAGKQDRLEHCIRYLPECWFNVNF